MNLLQKVGGLLMVCYRPKQLQTYEKASPALGEPPPHPDNPAPMVGDRPEFPGLAASPTTPAGCSSFCSGCYSGCYSLTAAG